MTGVLVVGLGSTDRGDDAIGPAVVRAVATTLGVGAAETTATSPRGGISVIEREDPTFLLDIWDEYDVAVVVDAVVSGASAGTVHVLEAGVDADPLGERARSIRGGTHAIGLGTVVELGRALGHLPSRLVLVGVEAAGFDPGAPLSRAVRASVQGAVDAVLRVVAPVRACAGEP